MGIKTNFAMTLDQNTFVTIQSGQTDSNKINFYGMQPRAILFPSTWTSCNVTFKVYLTQNGSPFLLSNASLSPSPISISTTAGQWLALEAQSFDAFPFLVLSCSVAQSSTQVVYIACQPIYQGIHG